MVSWVWGLVSDQGSLGLEAGAGRGKGLGSARPYSSGAFFTNLQNIITSFFKMLLCCCKSHIILVIQLQPYLTVQFGGAKDIHIVKLEDINVYKHAAWIFRVHPLSNSLFCFHLMYIITRVCEMSETTSCVYVGHVFVLR